MKKQKRQKINEEDSFERYWNHDRNLERWAWNIFWTIVMVLIVTVISIWGK